MPQTLTSSLEDPATVPLPSSWPVTDLAPLVYGMSAILGSATPRRWPGGRYLRSAEPVSRYATEGPRLWSLEGSDDLPRPAGPCSK